MNSSTNYESFNARNLSPEQVASTFIASNEYAQLWNNEHTVMLGPRGSGKTTLFKMLTVPAIYNWNCELAFELRRQRQFTAIYVPTDMHWHHQLKYSENQVDEIEGLRMAVSRCAVTTSILLAVVKTFQTRIRFEHTEDEQAEIETAKGLIAQWKLGPTIPNFEMVVLALKARIGRIRALINEIETGLSISIISENLPSYYYLDYFSEMDFACGLFDINFRLSQSKKWALCLDEMELAPEWYQKMALNQARSSDHSYLVKISTSPIPSVSGDNGAQPRQDFQLIPIWNDSSQSNKNFFSELATSVLSRRLGQEITPESILGTSNLMESDDDTQKYERGSLEWELFRDLARWDLSFNHLLRLHGIDPLDPYTDDISLRDSFLRKAKPIAMFRAALLKRTASGSIWLRSRKVPGVFSGADALFRISDGNPRRLIGILNDIVSRLRNVNKGVGMRLNENEQNEIFNNASSQFLGYINALPDGSASLSGQRLELATIIKSFATFVRRNLLGHEFILDPKGSFIVDSHLNRQVCELIRLGVYHGALVHVDPVPDAIETSVVGKRFRISYMLAPVFRLPLTLYGGVSLTSVLRASAKLRVKRVIGSLNQPELPNLKEE